MAMRRGRPLRYGVERYDSGRIKHQKLDIEPRDGPRYSREYQWLRDNLSEQALEAATWYAEFIAHRNRWLGYDEWKLPGDDLTVSERLGRKSFTALLTSGRYEPRPDFSSDGIERDDAETPQLEPSRRPLTTQFKQAERQSAADAAAEAMQSNEAALLQQQRFITQIEYFDSGLVRRRRIPEGVRGENVVYRKGHPLAGKPYQFGAREMMGRPENGPFPPRHPFRPPHAPPPVDQDEPCPECRGCTPQSCEWRERIRADDKGVETILRRRIDPADDIRRKRALLDHFALDGNFPAPFEIAPLEELLMRLHRFFKDAPSRADWDHEYKPRAKRLSVAERIALYAKQSPLAKAHEVILHVAKTEGFNLKYLGRVQSASQAAAAGGDLYKKAS